MALDGLTLYGITKELQNRITGAKIDKISQAENDEVLLSIRGDGKNFKLLISANSSNPRIYFVEKYKKENPLKAPMFLMILRKYIQSGRILKISQEGLERIIKFDIEAYDDLKTPKVRSLIIEIMGRHSNIILVDKDSNKILDSIKRIPITTSSVREVLPGKDYFLPPSQGKLNPISNLDFSSFVSKITSKDLLLYKAIYESYSGISPLIAKEVCYRASLDLDLSTASISNFQLERLFNSFERMINQIKNHIFYPCIVSDLALDKIIDFSIIRLTIYDSLNIKEYESISKATEEFYLLRDLKERMSQKNSSLKKLVAQKIDRLENKISKQKNELQETLVMEELKKKGDLLTSYIYMLEKGMKFINVPDFYNENSPEIIIELDENLSPSENIQKLYKKYNKLKKRKSELTIQINQSQEELSYLQNVLLSIENCESYQEIEDIRDELAKEGYIKSKGIDKKNKKRDASLALEPLEFKSTDGTKILVGRNNRQNDQLTFKISSPDDIWLHTKDIAGSHVIIKTSLDLVSESTLKEGAILAAYHSKGRLSSNVPVDYTSRKNVKKPSGAKPGMVIYENQHTVYITPKEEDIIRMRCINGENKTDS